MKVEMKMIDMSNGKIEFDSRITSPRSSSPLIGDRIKEFRENTDFSSVIFENLIGYAIIATDFDGNIMAYNEGAHLIFGYPPEEVIGRKNIEIFWPKEFTDSLKQMQIIDDLMREGRISFEGKMLRKEGEIFLADILLTLTKSLREEVVGYIIIVEDLTEKLQAEERRRAEERRQAEERRRIAQLEEEISTMRQISNIHQASTAAGMCCEISLQESTPDIFSQLVHHYGDLIKLRLERRIFKGKHDISGEIIAFSGQLGLIGAGPRDVIDIHSLALRAMIDKYNPKKSQVYLEEGRLMVLELMGYLVSYYRSGFTGQGRPPLQKSGK